MTDATHSPIGWVRKHTDEDLATGGKKGHRDHGSDTLVLTTVGRSSGLQRRTALIYGRDGADHLVVGSYGGKPEHPQWYRNLLVEPRVEVQVNDEVFVARARTADEAER